jgi:hypothetical protein
MASGGAGAAVPRRGCGWRGDASVQECRLPGRCRPVAPTLAGWCLGGSAGLVARRPVRSCGYGAAGAVGSPGCGEGEGDEYCEPTASEHRSLAGVPFGVAGRGAERARRRAMSTASRQRVSIAAWPGSPLGWPGEERSERGGEQ